MVNGRYPAAQRAVRSKERSHALSGALQAQHRYAAEVPSDREFSCTRPHVDR